MEQSRHCWSDLWLKVPEIGAEIFLHFENKQIFLRCALVCRSWKDFLSSKFFFEQLLVKEFGSERAGRFMQIDGAMEHLRHSLKESQMFRLGGVSRHKKVLQIQLRVRRVFSMTKFVSEVRNSYDISFLREFDVCSWKKEDLYLINIHRLPNFPEICGVLKMHIAIQAIYENCNAFPVALLDENLNILSQSSHKHDPNVKSWTVFSEYPDEVRFIAVNPGPDDLALVFPSLFRKLEKKSPMPELFEAAKTRNLVEVERLLRMGAEPNAKYKHNLGMTYMHLGSTALHYAAGQGNKDVAVLLIRNGADVSSKGYCGNTPLHEAAANGQTDLVALLIETGADLSSKSTLDGRTALHQAAFNGHQDVAALLIEKGADVSSTADYGRTALHLAAYNGHKDVAALLVDKGADVNLKGKSGWTALHWTACHGEKDVAALLIDKGADVNLKDNDGYTALHWAACHGEEDVIALLIRNGADVKSKTNEI